MTMKACSRLTGEEMILGWKRGLVGVLLLNLLPLLTLSNGAAQTVAAGEAFGADAQIGGHGNSASSIAPDSSLAQFGAIYARALSYEREGEQVLAIKSLQKLLRLDPDLADVRSRLAALLSERESRLQLTRLEQKYQEALQAYDAQDWALAKAILELIYRRAPDFRDVQQRLHYTRFAASSRSIRDFVASAYRDALAARERRDYSAALVTLERVQALQADYLDVPVLIPEVETLRRESFQSQTNAATTLATTVTADSLYRCALVAMAHGDWEMAIGILQEIQQIRPDYARLEVDLNFALQQAKREKLDPGTSDSSRSGVATGALIWASVVAVLVVGISLFFESVRVRVYQLIGKWQRAAALLERRLERHPNQHGCWLQLVALYARHDQADERAINAYEKALYLKWNISLHEKMRSLMTDYYLQEHQCSTRAVAFFEGELGRAVISRPGAKVSSGARPPHSGATNGRGRPLRKA